MMTRRRAGAQRPGNGHRRAVIELVLAAAAAAGCVVSWLRSRSTVDVAPIAKGEPSTTSVAYYAPLLVLALMLATAAGVLTVLAVARLRRASAETEFPVANARPGSRGDCNTSR